MYPKVCFAMAFAAILSAPPPAAYAAADNTLGMALMSAVVEADGTLISGSGVKSVTHSGTGGYYVRFERSVAGCTPVSSPLYGYYDNFVVVRHTPTPTPDSFQVLTGAVNGNGADTRFSLIVFCAK